tara:strand:+ start:6315 stop:6437 length:123 start_codon:yes stop_codon:yes gene_type:complete
MSSETCPADERKMTNLFGRFLTIWVGMCILAGILLGLIAP